MCGGRTSGKRLKANELGSFDTFCVYIPGVCGHDCCALQGWNLRGKRDPSDVLEIISFLTRTADVSSLTLSLKGLIRDGLSFIYSRSVDYNVQSF
jgi:hypothetical protein